jgi:hypothetical protein
VVTAEAEFIAAFPMAQEVTSQAARHLLNKLGFPKTDPTPVFEDGTTVRPPRASTVLNCIKWAGGAVGDTDRA